VNVTPVRLFKDTEYVIGGSDYGIGRGDYAYIVQGFTNSTGVVWLSPREVLTPSGGLAFPTYEQGANAPGIFGGNFQFTPVPSIPYSTIRFSEVEVCWTSETNKQYQVQYRSSLTTNTWQDLGIPVQGTGTNNCILDPIPRGEPQRYYRVLALP
jgi:hypothetical protein